MTVFPPLCVCREAIADVEMAGPNGTARMCRRCAGLLEMLLALVGERGNTKRRPVLELIRGSVE